MRQRELLIVNFVASGLRLVGTLAIAFVLTPILIRNLGIEVFGLLETIGASGLLLAMTTETLNVSISRELTYWMGAGNSEKLRKTFSSAFFMQLIAGSVVCAIGFFGAEWVISKLTVPVGYERAAIWALRFTALDFGIGFMTSPYWGIILATQDIRTYALLIFLKKLATLVAALAIPLGSNALLTFVIGVFAFNLIINLIPIYIGHHRHHEARPRFVDLSSELALSILRYASLTFVGRVGGQLRKNGGAIFLNIVFGNAITAANGVGLRLSGIIHQFVNVVVPAIQPAMTANTGANKQHVTHRLVTATSALSVAIAIPIVTTIFCDASSLLELWLGGTVPPYAEIFAKIVALTGTIMLLSKGHEMAQHATGKIGRLVTVYHAIAGTFFIVGAAVTYYLHDYPWLIKLFELFGVTLAAAVWQPIWVSHDLKVPLRDWYRETLAPTGILVLACTCIAFSVTAAMHPSFLRAVIIGTLCVVASGFTTWLLAFTYQERQATLGALKNIVAARLGQKPE